MEKKLEEYLANFLPELAKRGIRIIDQRDINYGIQLTLNKEGQQSILNIYYSEKNGLSKVIGGKENALKAELKELIKEKTESANRFHSWKSWIGSDECGKGDYFGALVVAAFAMDNDMLPDLLDWGVRDSKSLTRSQINDIAQKLYSNYPSRISCIMLKPIKYNEIIAEMQTQGKNLNDLLAWQHSTAILSLLDKIPHIQGILVDQFSRRQKVTRYLKKREITIPIEEKPKAEADPAVASASIIARYQFLQHRETMNNYYGMKFPLGSGKNVVEAAKIFADKYGWNRLAEVAKLHFITSRSVGQRSIFENLANSAHK